MFEKISSFLNEAVDELKKVVWPSRDDVVDSTLVVISVTFMVSFFLWIVDIGLQKMLSFIIG